jgi:hypothetical protein
MDAVQRLAYGARDRIGDVLAGEKESPRASWSASSVLTLKAMRDLASRFSIYVRRSGIV